MADPKNHLKYPQGSTMTPRLRATRPRPGVVPADNTKIEAEADALLRESGFDDAGRYGARVRGETGGVPMLPLDDERVAETLEQGRVSVWADDDDVDELMTEVTGLCGLTKREAQVVRAIVEGGVWGPHAGGYARVALELGTTAKNVKETWLRARKKLIEHWAADDYQMPEVKFHKSLSEGNGFTVVVGGSRTWGPQLDPKDRTRAVTVSTVSDADWKYEPSLDPEGWPLV